MNKKIAIKQKIVFMVLAVAFLAVAILSAVSYIGLVNMKNLATSVNESFGISVAESGMASLEERTKFELKNLSSNKALVVNAFFSKVENYLNIITDQVNDIYANPDNYVAKKVLPPNPANQGKLRGQLTYAIGVDEGSVQAEAGAVGNCITEMMGVVFNDEDIENIYLGTESGIVLTADRNSGDRYRIPSNHRERPWYKATKNSDSITWSSVYVDGFGKGLIMTCSKPFYDGDGKFMGVVSIDTPVRVIRKYMDAYEMSSTQGHSFIADNDGNIIICPHVNENAKENEPMVFENFLQNGNAEQIAVANKMLAGESGLEKIIYLGEEVYLAYDPLDRIGLCIATVVDLDEALAPAKSSKEDVLKLAATSSDLLSRTLMQVLMFFILAVFIVVIITIILGKKLSKRISDPILVLTTGVREISCGNLEYKFKFTSGDEFQDLADAFDLMTDELKVYVDNLSTATVDRERSLAELNVAKKIQASMLPKALLEIPKYRGFDIDAKMRPAKVVGGDFYDFFMLDNDYLAVVIADVSGKGVPAAMFMVSAKALIKNYTKVGVPPDEIFNIVNNQLCENNEAGMFVTAFIGILNINTGEFFYSNAGHTPPLVYRKGSKFRYLTTEKTLFLAGIEDTIYATESIILSEGDMLFLYTDGVTEAMDKEKVLFSKERLLGVMNEDVILTMTATEILSHIEAEIDKYSEGVTQADDITMLLVRYQEKEGTFNGDTN